MKKQNKSTWMYAVQSHHGYGVRIQIGERFMLLGTHSTLEKIKKDDNIHIVFSFNNFRKLVSGTVCRTLKEDWNVYVHINNICADQNIISNLLLCSGRFTMHRDEWLLFLLTATEIEAITRIIYEERTITHDDYIDNKEPMPLKCDVVEYEDKPQIEHLCHDEERDCLTKTSECEIDINNAQDCESNLSKIVNTIEEALRLRKISIVELENYITERTLKFDVLTPLEGEEDVFDTDFDVDDKNEDSFPEELIKDDLHLQRVRDSIKRHHANASDVIYEYVTRRIRTSRIGDKDHIKHRYKGYCQHCGIPSPYWEIAEISKNLHKEMPEMNLSLCPNHASEYRQLRENEIAVQKFMERIMNADVTANHPVRIADFHVQFTQIHLAQIQQIIALERNKKHG
jgi:hypothetical protein